MSENRRYREAEWLREQYCKQEKTTREIAEVCGCGHTTVLRWLGKHGIETRGGVDRRLEDAEWLHEQYRGQEKTTREIAEVCGCGQRTVCRWLDKHGIETRKAKPKKGALRQGWAADSRLKGAEWLREQYCEQERSTIEIAEVCGCANVTVGRWLDEHGIETRQVGGAVSADSRLKDAEWLCEQYCEQERSIRKIAEVCGCSSSTVGHWLDKHGIETRQFEGLAGADNPRWNGGRFPYGPGWTKQKRRTVRKRDGFECVRCGLSQSEHRRQHDEKLHVHHLTPARDVDDPEERNATENLVTLCRDCHNEYERFAGDLLPQLAGGEGQ